MKELFFKLIAAFRDRRFDMALLAVLHLVLRPLTGVWDFVTASENIGLGIWSASLAFLIFGYRAMTVFAVYNTPMVQGFAEFLFWWPFSFVLSVVSRALYRLGQLAFDRSEEALDNYRPRKRKSKD